MTDYPRISVLTPTFNRSKFLPLYLYNLVAQSYPHDKIEVCIYDDGTEPFCDPKEVQKMIFPMKLVYYHDKNKKTIGEKRNYLVKKLATSKVLIFQDDDDIYMNDYIKYSYDTLKENKAGLVGSNGMIFCYPEKDFKLTGIKCKKLFQIHEATMCFTRKYFNSMGGFTKSSQGEGKDMIKNQKHNVFETDINYVMICIAHSGNTVDKQQFDNDRTDQQAVYCGDRVSILKNIFKLK